MLLPLARSAKKMRRVIVSCTRNVPSVTWCVLFVCLLLRHNPANESLSTRGLIRNFTSDGSNFSQTHTYSDQTPDYCSIWGHSAHLEATRRIMQKVDLGDSNIGAFQRRHWVVRPFTFMTRARRTTRAAEGHDHVILVLIESLRVRDMRVKLPLTIAEAEKQGKLTNRIMNMFPVVRVGYNSLPNRGALLVGLESLANGKLPKERHSHRSLMKIAVEENYDVVISDTVNRPCEHYTNALSVMLDVCEPFAQAYSDVLHRASCSKPVDTEGKMCPQFPFPAPKIPMNCSGLGMHQIISAIIEHEIRHSNKSFIVLNSYDFHPPNLELISVDLDSALALILKTLNDVSKYFTFVLVGDHGQGVLNEDGDAAGLVLTTNSYWHMLALQYMNTSAMSTHFDINRLLRHVLLHGNKCQLKGIGKEFCMRCVPATRSPIWHFWYRLERSSGRLGTRAAIQIKLPRNLSCTTIEGSQEEYSGVEVDVILKTPVCSVHLLIQYAGDGSTVRAASNFGGFQACAARVGDVTLMLTNGDLPARTCILITHDPPKIIDCDVRTKSAWRSDKS